MTVCTKDRKTILAAEDIHEHLIAAWKEARSWLVGRYVIMPDQSLLRAGRTASEASSSVGEFLEVAFRAILAAA